MTAARFLYIAGACFLIAAVFKYLGKEDVAYAAYVPALVFLGCGVVALVHNYWTTRRARKQ